MPRPLSRAIERLYPGTFALVMATGALAMASNRLHVPVMNRAFYWLALAAFAAVLAMTLVRLARYPREVARDFCDPALAPSFFTAVAAPGVLGIGALRIVGIPELACGFWWLALALWLSLFYGFALTTITSREKLSWERAVNGGWLIIVVGAQAVSALASMLTERASAPGTFLVVGAAFFMVGCALYALIIIALCVRLLFVPLEPAQLVPSYWVMMGAAAISTLAGVEIEAHARVWQLQVDALPVVQGLTLFCWIAATAWIPLVVMLGVWRHVVRRHTLAYDPQHWSIVFPLGMYTVASHDLVETFHLQGLAWVPLAAFPVAILAWALTAGGMAWSLSHQGR